MRTLFSAPETLVCSFIQTRFNDYWFHSLKTCRNSWDVQASVRPELHRATSSQSVETLAYRSMRICKRFIESPFRFKILFWDGGTHSSIPRRHTAGSFMYQSQVNRFKVFCASWSRRYLCAALPLSASAYHTFSRLGASFWNLELLLHMHDIAFNSVQQAHNYLY